MAGATQLDVITSLQALRAVSQESSSAPLVGGADNSSLTEDGLLAFVCGALKPDRAWVNATVGTGFVSTWSTLLSFGFLRPLSATSRVTSAKVSAAGSR